MGVRTVGLALVALAACGPTIPDSGSPGVGFQDYSSYELRQAQAAAAAQARAGIAPRISDEVPSTASAALPPAAPPPPATAAADPAAPVGMSDEQDFEAVAARESIQSDAERIAEARARYQEVQPVAVPERPGQSDTLVIDFALATTNAVGQKIYQRGRFSQERFNRACAKYGSQDQAQEDFLKAGGPERDRNSMDPDGDGFACFWDPTPFRNARQGAVAAPIAQEVLPGGG